MMSILTKVFCSMVVFHACVLWGRTTSQSPSPVAFQTNHPAPLAFWIAREYGAIAVHPRPGRKQSAAIALDRHFGIDQLKQ